MKNFVVKSVSSVTTLNNLFAVFLLLKGINSTNLLNAPPKTTWAQLISPMNHNVKDNVPMTDTAENITRHNFNTMNKPQVSQSQIQTMNYTDPSKILQKRALDFIFHKFVEPIVHPHIERRPSLLEDLITTIDDHVRKDINAWNTPNTGTADLKSAQKLSGIEDSEISLSESSKMVVSPPDSNLITSVAHVEEGKINDTFLVTDEEGITHTITVDEIIDSLVQMKEQDIKDVMIDTSVEPNIERMDTVFLPSIYDDIHYSRKGTSQNDIVLIKDENGDTRLVTVKDLKPREQNKPNQNVPKNIPKPVLLNKPIINTNIDKTAITKSSITLNDLMHLYTPHSQKSVTIPTEDRVIGVNSHVRRPVDNDPLASIRQSLSELRQNAQNEAPARSQVPIYSNTPVHNSQLVKIVNADGSVFKLPTYENNFSVGIKETPETETNFGFRDRVSNFFSKLIGKPVSDVSVSKHPADVPDRVVQAIIPNSDTGGSEQVSIPLPKPIHFRGGKIISSSPIEKKFNNPIKAQRRSSQYDFSIGTQEKGEESVNVADIAGSILKDAKIPNSVREKLIDQIEDDPNFITTDLKLGLEESQDLQSPDKVSERFFVVKNKAKKKEIKFPDGYKYELPSYDYFDYYEPHVTHHHDKKPKGKHYDDDQPLIDFSLLADVVYLSKIGDDNESFSFPKIGDSSKFVDTRKGHHR